MILLAPGPVATPGPSAVLVGLAVFGLCLETPLSTGFAVPPVGVATAPTESKLRCLQNQVTLVALLARQYIVAPAAAAAAFAELVKAPMLVLVHQAFGLQMEVPEVVFAAPAPAPAPAAVETFAELFE